MTEEEKKFWENYKKQTLDRIEDLLGKKKKIAAAKLIFIAIENFGSFRAGRGKENSPNRVPVGGGGRASARAIKLGYEKLDEKGAFNQFIEQYLEELGPYKSKLWVNFRNGLVHEGIMRKGHTISINGPMVVELERGKLKINIKKLLQKITNHSLPRFDKEIESKKHVIDRWRERFKFLK